MARKRIQSAVEHDREIRMRARVDRLEQVGKRDRLPELPRTEVAGGLQRIIPSRPAVKGQAARAIGLKGFEQWLIIHDDYPAMIRENGWRRI